jgi:hypothetical protein
MKSKDLLMTINARDKRKMIAREMKKRQRDVDLRDSWKTLRIKKTLKSLKSGRKVRKQPRNFKNKSLREI